MKSLRRRLSRYGKRVVRHLRRSLRRKGFLATLAVLTLLLSLVFSLQCRVPTTFVVVAETEFVSGETAASGSISWELSNASICAGPRPPRRPDDPEFDSQGCGGTEVDLEGFSGHIDIESPVAFTIERIGAGPVLIGLRMPGPGSAESDPPFRIRLRSSETGGGVMRLPEPVFVQISDAGELGLTGQPLSLAVLARPVTFGREASLQSVSTQPLLKNGTVTVMGETRVGGRAYAGRQIQLNYGDQVTVEDASGNFSCLIRVDEGPALRAIFRVVGTRATIRSFFSEPRVESLSFFDEVTNDPLMVSLWSLLGVVLAVLGVIGEKAGSRGKRIR